MTLKDKFKKMNEELVKEQEDITPAPTPEVVEETEPTSEDILDEKIVTDDLIESDEKYDDFSDENEKSEALNREVDEAQEEAEIFAQDIESIEEPTDEDVAVASERLEMFKYYRGLKEFTLTSESFKHSYSLDNKKAMKEIATEFRKQARYLNLAREANIGNKLADWLYTIFTFGHKRFKQLRRELTSSIYKNYDNLDEGNKIIVAKCLYRTIAEISYMFKYFSASSVNKLTVDIEDMLKHIRTDAKDMSERMRNLFEVLDEIYKKLAKEHPIAVASGINRANESELDRAKREKAEAEAKKKIAEATLKALAKETLKNELEKKDFGEIVKKTFSEDFMKYSLDEYMSLNKGEIDKFIATITLETANTIQVEKLKYILDDLFDVYDFSSDYVFRNCSVGAEEVLTMLNELDVQLTRYVTRFYNLSGTIRDIIHKEIYDAFVILRK